MKKQCFKCLRELPLEMFYKHKKMSDGHLNKCIECTQLDSRQNRLANIEKCREYDRTRPNKAERMKQSNARTNPQHEKRTARIIAGNALRDGRLIKQPCFFCGKKERVEIHHPDYTKPLKVYWICKVCHRRLHRIIEATMKGHYHEA